MKLLTCALVPAMLGLAGISMAQQNALADLPRHVALNERLHVSGQPSAEAIGRLRAAGIQTIIDLRPDAETPELDEKAEAGKAGLDYRALPIAGAADLTRENVVRFDRLLQEAAAQNVLMHCASGNRVGAMMALRARWIEGKSAEEALAVGRAAGMTGLETEVKRLVASEVAAPPAEPAR